MGQMLMLLTDKERSPVATLHIKSRCFCEGLGREEIDDSKMRIDRRKGEVVAAVCSCHPPQAPTKVDLDAQLVLIIAGIPLPIMLS